MSKKAKGLMTLCLMVVVALVISGIPFNSAEAKDKIVIKFPHVTAPSTPKGKAIDLFRDKVNAKFKGKVEVQVFPSSQLYNATEAMEALQQGVVQMAAPATSKFGAFAKEFILFDFPFVFPSKKVALEAFRGELGEATAKILAPHKMKQLAWFDGDFQAITANSNLYKPKDFKGLKFRVAPVNPWKRRLATWAVYRKEWPLRRSIKDSKLASSMDRSTAFPISQPSLSMKSRNFTWS